MATATLSPPVPQIVAHRVERAPRGLVSWLTTTDHKRIGILYMVTTWVFFILGGVEALMMRLQLGRREQQPRHPRGLQPALHAARHDDDLPLRRADDGGLRQLLRAADDRRARRRLPAAERALLLAVPLRRHRLLRLDLLDAARRRLDLHRPARVDHLLALGRRGRLDLPDPPHRHLVAPRRDQLLRDDHQHARAGHDLVAPAALRLVDPDLLDHPDHRAPRDRGARSRCCCSTATSAPTSSTRRRAARCCCGRTCSGSSATPRST